MAILVTGGAGYIGSHCVAALNELGRDVVVADNLSKGHKKAVTGGKFYLGDLRDTVFLDRIFRENDIEAVIHFAAFSLVGESCEKPWDYFNNNFGGSMSLLERMSVHGVKKIVFSSTAATYGEPQRIPIAETDVQMPTNPYGESKLAVEKMLKWCDPAYGIKFVALRYFNVAGAHESGDIGEAHNPESHLIPIILQAAQGKLNSIKVFGSDYPTPDGTCIRDYVHVTDLISAHLLALEYLKNGEESNAFNLGNGEGFSVKQVIDIAREVTGLPFKVIEDVRRAGDPAVLIASSQKAMDILKWSPKHADLKDIVASAWNWHTKHPDGYND
jgi:UDP-glucose 4-epimerase